MTKMIAIISTVLTSTYKETSSSEQMDSGGGTLWPSSKDISANFPRTNQSGTGSILKELAKIFFEVEHSKYTSKTHLSLWHTSN